MSAEPPKEPEANQTLQQALTGNGALKNGPSDEAALVKLFMDLTGESELVARSALMFVTRDREDSTTDFLD